MATSESWVVKDLADGEYVCDLIGVGPASWQWSKAGYGAHVFADKAAAEEARDACRKQAIPAIVIRRRPRVPPVRHEVTIDHLAVFLNGTWLATFGRDSDAANYASMVSTALARGAKEWA